MWETFKWQFTRFRWKLVRMLSGWDGNVLLYGAVGDGVTDDSRALQDAFNAGAGNLSPGAFIVSRPMMVDCKIVGATEGIRF